MFCSRFVCWQQNSPYGYENLQIGVGEGIGAYTIVNVYTVEEAFLIGFHGNAEATESLRVWNFYVIQNPFKLHYASCRKRLSRVYHRKAIKRSLESQLF